MKFRATVADPRDGREFEMQIPANDENEARRIVKQKGLLLSGLMPPPIANPAEIETAQIPPPTKPPAEQPKWNVLNETKDRYPAMTLLSWVLRMFAILTYFIAAACVVFAFVIAIDQSWQKERGFNPSTFGVMGAQFLLSGLVLHAIGQSLIALRDIAQNSFK